MSKGEIEQNFLICYVQGSYYSFQRKFIFIFRGAKRLGDAFCYVFLG